MVILVIQQVWCEERDSNPHTRGALTPEASASTNSATFAHSGYQSGFTCCLIKAWCEERDSNPHIRGTLTPEASASTNSATFAH